MAQQKLRLESSMKLQYTITIILMIAIATAGYFVGRNNPTPAWIDQYLIPGLGWLGLVLMSIVAIDWLMNLNKPR